jgi:hypothetical protein
MTGKVTDILLIEKLFEVSGVENYTDNFNQIIKDIITELYYSHQETILKLRLKHIDRAIFKYRQASETRKIFNTKQYLKACILSAIVEAALDEIEYDP